MSNQMNILKADEIKAEIAFDFSSVEGIRWINPPDSEDILIAGFPWIEEDRIYRRLPLRVKDMLRPPVDALANNTAGGQLHFTTDSNRLYIAVKMPSRANMYHMPATGQCGFDVYIGDQNEVRYYKTTRFDHSKDSYASEMFSFPKKKMRTVVLNFPLYMGVQHVLVGIDEGAAIGKSDFLKPGKKNVFYGTSITQGGCASRPGMAYTNILSRMMKEECINLGFSGNGQGDAIVAECMAEIDASCYILDYVANCTVEMYKDTLPGFMRILKNKRPHVPIYVISALRKSFYYFMDDLNMPQDPKDVIGDFIVETIEMLKKEGYDQMYFIDGSRVLGEDFEETTVDGSHPTDLGFYNMAKILYPVLAKEK
jgi:hypothetical protein